MDRGLRQDLMSSLVVLLLSAHYRAPLDFSDAGLREAKAQLDRLYQALRNAKEIKLEDDSVGFPNLGNATLCPDVPQQTFVLESLADDLNTPLAISRLHDLATRLNSSQ